MVTQTVSRHASQGLAMQLVELQSDISEIVDGDLQTMEDTCATWKPYYESAQWGQDDSGI